MFAQQVDRPDDHPEEDRSDDAECPKPLAGQSGQRSSNIQVTHQPW